jgi:hypothetical protein
MWGARSAGNFNWHINENLRRSIKTLVSAQTARKFTEYSMLWKFHWLYLKLKSMDKLSILPCINVLDCLSLAIIPVVVKVNVLLDHFFSIGLDVVKTNLESHACSLLDVEVGNELRALFVLMFFTKSTLLVRGLKLLFSYFWGGRPYSDCCPICKDDPEGKNGKSKYHLRI